MPLLYNPYQDMKAVRSGMFFGRRRILRRLYSAIVSQQCVSLVGSRHIGKSSVLQNLRCLELQRRYEYDLSRHLLISIDLREYLQKSSDDFFDAVCKQIILQSPLSLDVNGLAGEDEFCEILDQINEQGFHPVLLMDSFDNITRNKSFCPDFFSFLRAQATRVSYVTASLAPLSTVCHTGIETSPFFNIFGTSTLESLEPDEARQLVAQPADKAGLCFSDAEIEWVLTLAGRHPFFLQRVCYHLFDEKMNQVSGEVDRRLVKDRAYNELCSHFEDTWVHLSEENQQALKDEAQRRGQQSRALPELSESSLFRRFVRDKCHLHLFKMTIEDVENVLDQIDDSRALGESELKHLQIVIQRVKKQGAVAVIDRGLAVREVLKEAFDHLRGSGVRNDMGSDWRLYNILYYRYFRKGNRLKNEHVATRLECSLRKYFRDRNKAIEALFDVLLEMEHSIASDDDE